MAKKKRAGKAKKRVSKKGPMPTASNNRVSLAALHKEFKRIQAQLDTGLKLAPNSANYAQLKQDLASAAQMLDCAQQNMFVLAV
jgi:hypothetical protein